MATGQVLNFGPWTARSQRQAQSAGSSERGIMQAEAADGLHKDVHPKPKATEPTLDKKMSLTRSKTSPPDFTLASGKNGSQDSRHNPKVQRERMTMFKRQLAANRTRGTEEVLRRNKANAAQKSSATELPSKDSFVTKSMVENLREERQGGPGDQRGTVCNVDSLQIATEDWPFVYFVVALDQMPVASEDLGEYKVGKPHTARERQRFLAARKRRIQQSREEMERIRESNIDMGLRLEPIRPPTRDLYHQPTNLIPPQQARSGMVGEDVVRKAPGSSKHPPTPNSSGSSRDFPVKRQDFYLNGSDSVTMEDMMCRGFSQWFSDNFSTASNSQPGSRPSGEVVSAGAGRDRGLSSLQKDSMPGSAGLGLPEIALGQAQRKVGTKANMKDPISFSSAFNVAAEDDLSNANNSNNNNKKVHFAEGLPYIKGSGIAVPTRDKQQDPELKADKVRPDTTACPTRPVPLGPPTLDSLLQPPWSAPVTIRSLPTLAQRSKHFKPMPIPKIDIVSEIYDELIVKTIQSFLEREGYTEDKFTNLRQNVMARLSATYPHLARHRAWKVVRRDAKNGTEVLEPVTESDERNRLRLRPLHQGFFATGSGMEDGGQYEFGHSRDQAYFLGQLHFPRIKRQPNEHVKPRWVPVIPNYRPSPMPEEDNHASPASFMAIDGRHIACTPRDALHFKTVTLPGATSDFRMGPLMVTDDGKPSQSWTHIIPSGIDE